MSRPVIALLTDFGNRDHYAGTMKGVALGICPEATLVDISHEVAAGDVLAAALELAAAYRYFPGGSIFLVVVDPGVGSSRRGLAAEAGAYRFVAPDNGVLSIVFDENPPIRVVELSEARYARPTMSRTFEGRDRFAPAAAWLANRHRADGARPSSRGGPSARCAAGRATPLRASKEKWCASTDSAISSRTSIASCSSDWPPAIH